MSFFFKSPRLATCLVRFAREGEFCLRKRKISLTRWQYSFEVNKTFFRSYALACQSSASLSTPENTKETLYEKAVSQICHDIKFKGYILREHLNDVWHTLKYSTTFTTEQTAILISSCGHKLAQETALEKLKLVKEIWDSFDKIGIKKTICHYNALLDVYIELEHSFSPKDFLHNLKEQGLAPDFKTYKKLLHALSIQGNISSSKDLLEHMKMHSVSIDEGVFNSLILGHSLQGDFISARGILELMKEKGLKLSSESYVSFALGYAKHGEIEKVRKIMDECREQRIIMSAAELLEIAYTFAAQGHPEHFSTILDMITLKKNFPIFSTIVVHRLLHKNLDREALILFDIHNKLGLLATIREPLKMFLDHYIRFRKPDEVLNIVETFQEKGWSPIAFAYCLKETLIRKDISHCLNFFDVMRTRKYPLRIHYFYPILIKTRLSGNEKVLEMIRLITTHGLKFSREAVKAFHKFYDFLPGAEFDDLKKIKEAGVNTKLIAWKILDTLLHRKNVNGAVKLVSTYGIAYPAVILPVSMATAFTKEANHKNYVYILSHLIHNLKANKIIRGKDSKIKTVEYEFFLVEIAKACDKTFNLRVLKEMLKKEISISPNAADFISKKFSCPEISALVSKLTSADLKFKFDQTLLNRLLEKRTFEKQQFSGKERRKNNWAELDEALERKEEVPAVMRIFEDLLRETEFSIVKRHENIVQKLFKYVSLKGDVTNSERIYKYGIRKNLFSVDNYTPCLKARLIRGHLNDAVRRYYDGLKTTKRSKALETIIREIKKSKNGMALNDLKIAISEVYGEFFATVQLLDKFAKLGYASEMRKILIDKSNIGEAKPLFNKLCQKLSRKNNLIYIETLEKASRNIPQLNLTSVYYRLLELYTLDENLKKILTLYVELERDDAMREQFRNLFFTSLKNWRGSVSEELKMVLQCVLEDCEAKKSLKGTETASFEENSNISTKGVHPHFGGENESRSNFNNEDNILKCFCLIQAGKLCEYFKILRVEIAKESVPNAKNYFFCYKLVPHVMTNQKYLDEYENLIRMCGSPVFWEKYFKLCVRLKNAQGINTAMEKLDSNRLKFCLQGISFKDCLRVIDNANCDKKLGKFLAFFYTKIISQCLKENKFEATKIYYEKARKRGLNIF